MNTTYKAVVRKDGDWWIGWIEEIAGVNCQEIPGGVIEELEGYASGGVGVYSEGSNRCSRFGLRRRINRGMKRAELIRYLRAQGCEFIRVDSSHSWWHTPN